MSEDVAVKVIFCNDRLSRRYQPEIDVFLKKLLRNERILPVSYEVLKKVESDDGTFFYSESSSSLNDKSTANKPPKYDLLFDEPIGCKPPNSEVPQEKNRPQVTCFNCLGEHHLKDCPEDHDGMRIATNRRDLMEMPTVRYHTDDVQPVESSTVRPGYISEKLRQALNLNSHQLPFYIYNMRVLGYPPGWLKEAEIEKSGLSVYSSTTDARKNDKSDSSDGPLEQYDGNKFIKFPGFNTPVPYGIIDEWKNLKKPPLQDHQLLSEALKHRRVTISPEFKKRKKSDVFITDCKKTKTETSGFQAPVSLSSDRKPANSRNGCQTPISNKPPKLVFSGSPLIDTGNPCKRLPDANKFSVGISEYLPYENLPDAVGSYDRVLRGILVDVRETITQQELNLS